MSARGEYWRVMRFLNAHNVGFTRSDSRYPYDKTTIYIDGHTLRNLAALYDREALAGLSSKKDQP